MKKTNGIEGLRFTQELSGTLELYFDAPRSNRLTAIMAFTNLTSELANLTYSH